MKVAHRDMKPENILIDSSGKDMVIKIIDFGTSQTFDPKEHMTQAFGTCYYVAPEVLNEIYSEKCDIWSIGVILYVLLCGEPPFNGPDDQAILDQVKLGYFSFSNEIWASRTKESKDLIKKMLCMNADKRISASESLQHPWITTCAKNKVDDESAKSALSNLTNFRAGQKL